MSLHFKYLAILIWTLIISYSPTQAFKGFPDLGCNEEPISTTHYLVEAGYSTTCYPGVSCNPTNETIIRTVSMYDAVIGSTVCYTVNNDTEFNGTGHVNANYPSLVRVEFIDNIVNYPVLSVYSAAVNINFETNCMCSCPDSPSRLKCYDGFDFCRGNNYCQNYFYKGIYSDCVGNNLGFLSQDSHACCAFSFEKHDKATFFTIGPKVTSFLKADINFYVMNSTTGPLYVQNGPILDLLTFPNTYQIGAFRDNVDPNIIEGIAGWYAPQFSWNLTYVGQFDGNTYNGGDIFAEYQGNLYYVPNANKINEYEPTKCGWIKEYTTGAENQRFAFDAHLLKDRTSVKVKSCVNDNFNISSDITPCLTSNWIPINDYLSKFGELYVPVGDNAANYTITQGLISMSATKPGGSLITLSGFQNYYSISYTYGVSTYTCTSTSNFQSANITCNVVYTEGASYIVYTVYDSVGNISTQGNVIVDGSGQSTISFNIPSSKFSVVDKLCLNSIDNQPRCQNITVKGFDLNVTDPSWTIKVDTNGTKPSRSENSIDFDFFDWETWGDNIWQTIIGWVITFVIFLVIVGAVILFIMFLPNIINIYHQIRLNGIRRKNSAYELLQKNQQDTEDL